MDVQKKLEAMINFYRQKFSEEQLRHADAATSAELLQTEVNELRYELEEARNRLSELEVDKKVEEDDAELGPISTSVI